MEEKAFATEKTEKIGEKRRKREEKALTTEKTEKTEKIGAIGRKSGREEKALPRKARKIKSYFFVTSW